MSALALRELSHGIRTPGDREYSQILAGERARVGGGFQHHGIRLICLPRRYSVDGARIMQLAPDSFAGSVRFAAVEDGLEAVDAVSEAFVVVFADVELEHTHAFVLGKGEPEPEFIGVAVDGETV